MRARAGPRTKRYGGGSAISRKIGWIVVIGPFQEMRAEPRQFAQLLFEGIEVAELLDASGSRTRHSGGDDFGLVEAEDGFRRAKLIEQQAAGSRSDASHAPQRQPICIWSRHVHYALHGNSKSIGAYSDNKWA